MEALRTRRITAIFVMMTMVATLMATGSEVASAEPGGIVISELHYHAGSDLDTDDFIELTNTGTAAIDASGWSFSQGITATLAPGTVIPAGARYVLAADAARFATLYGFAPRRDLHRQAQQQRRDGPAGRRRGRSHRHGELPRRGAVARYSRRDRPVTRAGRPALGQLAAGELAREHRHRRHAARGQLRQRGAEDHAGPRHARSTGPEPAGGGLGEAARRLDRAAHVQDHVRGGRRDPVPR